MQIGSYKKSFVEKLDEALLESDESVKKKYRVNTVKEINMGSPSGWQSRRRPSISNKNETIPKTGRPIKKSRDSSKAGAGHYY